MRCVFLILFLLIWGNISYGQANSIKDNVNSADFNSAAQSTQTQGANTARGNQNQSVSNTTNEEVDEAETEEQKEERDLILKKEQLEDVSDMESEGAPEQTSEVSAQKKDSNLMPIKKIKRPYKKSQFDSEYRIPIYFNDFEAGVKALPPELHYDLTQDSGKVLKIGNTEISEKTFAFIYTSLGAAAGTARSVVSDREQKTYHLLMKWPKELMETPNLEVISKTGRVLWSMQLTDGMLRGWKYKTLVWKKNAHKAGVKNEFIQDNQLFNSTFGISNLTIQGIPIYKIKDEFKFCFSSIKGFSRTRLCSQMYGINREKNQVLLSRISGTEVQPRILLGNQNSTLKNIKVVDYKTVVSFYAELRNGEIYEFITKAIKPTYVDAVETSKENIIKVVGYGPAPIQKYKVLNPEGYGTFTKLIGFEATIKDPRRFWATVLLKNNPVFYFNGENGGVFTHRFLIKDVPLAIHRLRLSNDTIAGTYIDDAKLYGLKPLDAKLKTSQNSVEINEDHPELFLWRFKAENRGEINRASITSQIDGRTYLNMYELYKGYPRELSFRLSGVLTTLGNIFIGEMAYNHWFESILGSNNYLFSVQRWGISFKYFNALSDLPTDDSGGHAALNVMDFDLKYRNPPGLWGRDEAVGLILSYHQVSWGTVFAPMIGTGAFWARSMPRAFDELFNIVPIMRYPKWVDMELIYYVQTLSPEVQLGTNFALNFHGKVLWSPFIFGEAGFGLRSFNYLHIPTDLEANLYTLYGTMGLGINF